MEKNRNSTHSNDSFAKAEGTPAAVLRLILRLVVAQCVVLQNHPTVLPSMDVVCPLKHEALLLIYGSVLRDRKNKNRSNVSWNILKYSVRGIRCYFWRLRLFERCHTAHNVHQNKYNKSSLNDHQSWVRHIKVTQKLLNWSLVSSFLVTPAPNLRWETLS